MSQKIDLIFTRDFCLCTTEIWHGLLVKEMKEELGQGINLQIARFNGRASEYYRLVEEMDAFKNHLVNKDLDDEVFSESKYKEFMDNIAATVDLVAKVGANALEIKRKFFRESVKLFKLIYPPIPLSNFLPRYREDFLKIHPNQEAEDILQRWYQARVNSEGKFEAVDAYWREMIGDCLEHLGISRNYSRVVKFEELTRLVENNQSPNLKDLEKRQLGYIFYQGDLIVEQDFSEFLQQHNFEYPYLDIKQDLPEIKGQVASPGGIIKGLVQTVMNSTEVAGFQKRNILVTTMTVPEFVPAMKQAKAIITDEGGITCHAAIVSREMKIPCIIGTRLASQVLKDGDLIEADFNKGIVRKIN